MPRGKTKKGFFFYRIKQEKLKYTRVGRFKICNSKCRKKADCKDGNLTR